VLLPYDPVKNDPTVTLKPLSAVEGLRSDELGRDVLSRIIYGARVSIFVSVVWVSIELFVGVVAGLISVFYEGMSRSVTRAHSLPGDATGLAG
jgi:glutathione transport system permease protein